MQPIRFRSAVKSDTWVTRVILYEEFKEICTYDPGLEWLPGEGSQRKTLVLISLLPLTMYNSFNFFLLLLSSLAPHLPPPQLPIRLFMEMPG